MPFAVHLSGWDFIVITAYVIVSIGLGVWLGRHQQTADDYFLAGRNMRWPVIGTSLFASNISSTTLVGLAGAAYTTGIAVYNYEWMASVVLVVFAIFFLPAILRSRVYTLPEFLERRFSSASRTYFSLLTLFLNIVVDTAGSLYAGAVIFQFVAPDMPFWQIIALLALAAGIYTIMGGLAAVMITDVIQAIVLVAASIFITISAFDNAGGWASIASQVSAEQLSLIRPLDDAAVPWLGLVIGIPLLGFYFWCTNQFMAQRVLSAKNDDEGRWGVLFAGLLKLPVLFIMVLPGTAAIVLYPNLSNGDLAYPALMFDLLPAGLLGLGLAGFIAALMSQIDSTLNSASTLVTMDFVRRLKPDMSQKALMRAGQTATFLFMLAAVAWAPQIKNFQSLFSYLQAVLAYAIGPVIVLFVFGMFWKRANATGAHWAITAGIVFAIILFVFNNGLLGTAALMTMDLHFLYIAPLVVVVSSLALIVGSLRGEAPREDEVLAYMWTRASFNEETQHLKTRPAWTNYRYQSIALLILTGVIVYLWR